MKKYTLVSIILITILIISFFEPVTALGKSGTGSMTASQIKKTNKKADKAFLKKVKQAYKKNTDEWEKTNPDNVTVRYVFKDLTGDGIHEAVIYCQHNTYDYKKYEFSIYSYQKKKAKLLYSETKSDNYSVTYNGHTVEWNEMTPYKEIRSTGYTGRDAYTVYLKLLQGEKEKIDGYTWQHGWYGYGVMTEEERPRAVALVDVYGDDTPELIYFKATNTIISQGLYEANMFIVTYLDGEAKIIFDMYSDWAWGGKYFFFQQNGDKSLYLKNANGDEWWEEVYYKLEDNGRGLMKNEKYKLYCSYDYDPQIDDLVEVYTFTKDATRTVTEDEYKKAVAKMQNNTSALVMYNGQLNDEVEKDFVDKNGCLAMTTDEAIAYLKEIVGKNINSQ